MNNVMNNIEAIGYMIKAAHIIGLDNNTLQKLVGETDFQMGNKNDEQARKVYRDFFGLNIR